VLALETAGDPMGWCSKAKHQRRGEARMLADAMDKKARSGAKELKGA
jgi:hypothetical protein